MRPQHGTLRLLTYQARLKLYLPGKAKTAAESLAFRARPASLYGVMSLAEARDWLRKGARVVLPKRLRRRMAGLLYSDRLSLLRADAVLVSFPKSGRTWLRLGLGRLLQQHFSLDPSLDPMEIEKLADNDARVPRIRIRHEGTPHVRRASELSLKTRLYERKKIIFLARDPRDVVVSLYFQQKKREGVFTGKLSDFLEQDDGPMDAIIRYYNLWIEMQDRAKDFLLVRYEDMHQDFVGVLQQVTRFCGIEDVPVWVFEDASQFASFDNMRKMETEQSAQQSHRLSPGDISDPESYKTRRGKVGGYTDYVDAEQAAYLNQKLISLDSTYGYS